MGKFARSRPFWSFYTIAFGIALFFWTYVLIIEIIVTSSGGPEASIFGQFFELLAQNRAAHPILHHHGDSILLYVNTYIMMPIALGGFFFPFAPTVAAITVTWAGYGRQALMALLSLMMPLRGAISLREGVRIYLIVLGFIFLLAASQFVRDALTNGGGNADIYVQHLGLFDWRYLVVTTFVALFFNQGGLLEELGWRGYAQPLLMRYFASPLNAALLLGVAWAMWHFPREIPPLLAGEQTMLDVVIWHAAFIPSCCAMSVVVAYFVNITGGSVIPAIMLHGSLNHIGGMLTVETTGARSSLGIDSPIMWVVAAIIIVIVAGRDLGWRRRLELHGGDGSTDPSLAWIPSRQTASAG